MGPKLLLMTNRKLHMRFQLVPKSSIAKWTTFSCYFMPKSVFGQQGCCTLTITLAGLSC